MEFKVKIYKSWIGNYSSKFHFIRKLSSAYRRIFGNKFIEFKFNNDIKVNDLIKEFIKKLNINCKKVSEDSILLYNFINNKKSGDPIEEDKNLSNLTNDGVLNLYATIIKKKIKIKIFINNELNSKNMENFIYIIVNNNIKFDIFLKKIYEKIKSKFPGQINKKSNFKELYIKVSSYQNEEKKIFEYNGDQKKFELLKSIYLIQILENNKIYIFRAFTDKIFSEQKIIKVIYENKDLNIKSYEDEDKDKDEYENENDINPYDKNLGIKVPSDDFDKLPSFNLIENKNKKFETFFIKKDDIPVNMKELLDPENENIEKIKKSFLYGKFKNTNLLLLYGSIVEVNKLYKKIFNKELGSHCIVNASNDYMKSGGGVCGTIYNTAGVYELEKNDKKVNKNAGQEGALSTGNAMSVEGTDKLKELKIDEVVHALAPDARNKLYEDEKKYTKSIESVYFNAILTSKNDNVVIPSLGTGIFKCDVRKTSFYAMRSTYYYILSKNKPKKNIVFVCFDSGGYKRINSYEDFGCYALAMLSVFGPSRFSSNNEVLINNGAKKYN